MIDKSSVGSNDIIYQTVSYIAAHYTEELTLSKTAHDLGISQSSLSRVFSGTFHTNFNRYLNRQSEDIQPRIPGTIPYVTKRVSKAAALSSAFDINCY